MVEDTEVIGVNVLEIELEVLIGGMDDIAVVQHVTTIQLVGVKSVTWAGGLTSDLGSIGRARSDGESNDTMPFPELFSLTIKYGVIDFCVNVELATDDISDNQQRENVQYYCMN